MITEHRCEMCNAFAQVTCVRCTTNLCLNCKIDLSSVPPDKLKSMIPEFDNNVEEFSQIIFDAEKAEKEEYIENKDDEYYEKYHDKLDEKLFDILLSILKTRELYMCMECHDSLSNICAMCKKNSENLIMCKICVRYFCRDCVNSFRCWDCTCKETSFRNFILSRLKLCSLSEILKSYESSMLVKDF